MPIHFSYPEFEIVIAALDHASANCMREISSVRLLLEDAYAAGVLSLHQWRVLWEDVSLVQARCALIQPQAWRFPAVSEEWHNSVPLALCHPGGR